MLMKTSKVVEITNIKEWKWSNMTIFYITVKLENWEKITLGKRKKDWIVVGQSITYTEEETEDGRKKYKEVRASFGKGSWGITNRQIAAIGGAIISASWKGDFKSSAEVILSWLEA